MLGLMTQTVKHMEVERHRELLLCDGEEMEVMTMEIDGRRDSVVAYDRRKEPIDVNTTDGQKEKQVQQIPAEPEIGSRPEGGKKGAAALQEEAVQNSGGNNAQIRKAVEEINKKAHNSEAVFGVHDATNRVTIKIVDKDSRQVLKEYPPEKTLDMIAKLWEVAGLLMDEKL